MHASGMIVDRRDLLAGTGSLLVGSLWATHALGQEARLQDRFGIIYFFAQSCGACKQQGPILRQLSAQTGFQVMAVSEDGGPSEDFPQYRVDSGQRLRMGIQSNATPTLALFDTQTRQAVEISNGVVPADEILRRIGLVARRLERSGG